MSEVKVKNVKSGIDYYQKKCSDTVRKCSVYQTADFKPVLIKQSLNVSKYIQHKLMEVPGKIEY